MRTRFLFRILALVLGCNAALTHAFWEATHSFGPGNQAARRIQPALDWADALFLGLEVDEASKERLRSARDQLGKLELDPLLGEQVTWGGPARDLKSVYHFSLPVGQQTEGTFLGNPDAFFGGWRGFLGLSLKPPLEARADLPRHFKLGFQGRLAIGDFQWVDILGFWKNILQFAEKYSGVEPLAIWSAVRAQSPEFARFIDRFFLLEGIAVKEKDYTRIDLHWHIRVSAFKNDFPHLYARLNKIGRIGETQGLILNEKNQRILKYKVRTDPRTVRLQFLVRNGELLPFDLDETPLTGGASFSITAKKNQTFQILQTIRFEASGVKIDVENLRWQMQINRESSDPSLALSLERYDHLSVNGRVLGFIPLSWVELFLPDSIENGVKNSLDASTRAYGTGTTQFTLKLYSPQLPRKPGFFELQSQGVTLENAFLKFALKVSGARLTPSDEDLQEFGRLIQLYYRALRADYISFRDRGIASQLPK